MSQKQPPKSSVYGYSEKLSLAVVFNRQEEPWDGIGCRLCTEQNKSRNETQRDDGFPTSR